MNNSHYNQHSSKIAPLSEWEITPSEEKIAVKQLIPILIILTLSILITIPKLLCHFHNFLNTPISILISIVFITGFSCLLFIFGYITLVFCKRICFSNFARFFGHIKGY